MSLISARSISLDSTFKGKFRTDKKDVPVPWMWLDIYSLYYFMHIFKLSVAELIDLVSSAHRGFLAQRTDFEIEFIKLNIFIGCDFV